MKETVPDVNEGLSAWLGDLGRAKYVSGPHFPVKLSTSWGLTCLPCRFDRVYGMGWILTTVRRKLGRLFLKQKAEVI